VRSYFLIYFVALALISSSPAVVQNPQILSDAFEMRYFTYDPKANGLTDFKGITEYFNTNERINFLKNYGIYARNFFNDPNLDTKVVTNAQTQRFLDALKPQPLTKIRKTIPLDIWKWIGYKPGQRLKKERLIKLWLKNKSFQIIDGQLFVRYRKAIINQRIPTQKWRFSFRMDARSPSNAPFRITFYDNETPVAVFGKTNQAKFFYKTKNDIIEAPISRSSVYHTYEIEFDLPNNKCNIYLDNQLKADFIDLLKENVNKIDNYTIRASQGQYFDNIRAVSYQRKVDTNNLNTWDKPFEIKTIRDQDFLVKPLIEGYQKINYDDSRWYYGKLPIVHGGERFAGEDLYLRRFFKIPKQFDKAYLNIETLDPKGEVWVNGESVARTRNRHPYKIDITEYINRGQKNLIAIKVDSFAVKQRMRHTPTDKHIGWFAGRMSLEFTSNVHIDDLFAYTLDANDPAVTKTQITLKNTSDKHFRGFVDLKFFPWFPEEANKPVASIKIPVHVRPWSDLTVDGNVAIPSPNLWTFDSPNLYKLQAVLTDDHQNQIDDYVTTTGFRTISQAGGTFRINGKPQMLNGAQIMGFRLPLENVAKWNRCAPPETLAEELLMIKKMNGNLMRVHVHAWENPARGINDPRIAEMADQLGMMLIWTTTSWVRTGQGWGIDFAGLPKYIKQVRNHPSIVMFEASNHPNKFKDFDYEESNLFVEKVYNSIFPYDPSRLISPISHNWHLHYGNDQGTIDHKGNPIKPSPAWTAPMVTRGNQDSYTGYGNTWSTLRKAPGKYRQSFLDSPHRAYFNFEHEESIGQPNWNLAKGRPWYQLQSYEWDYDTGSIGRRLTANQWLQSQAWQAFSAYEAIKYQRILDYDGFSWCCLRGGANTGVYKKPLIDNLGHAKLAYYANKMAFQRVLAGSDNVDTAYGPDDMVTPIILNLGDKKSVNLTVNIYDLDKNLIDSQKYSGVTLPAGRTKTRLKPFKPDLHKTAPYAFEYIITK